jgi:hypothetical protein
MDELANRRDGNALVMVCGESNIVSLVRARGEVCDSFGFARALQNLNVSVILNPVHDYMRRYEMREKRRFVSQGGRTVVSVWNKGKGREPILPWTVFHAGTDKIAAVRDLPTQFADRPDIHIGVLDLAAM